MMKFPDEMNISSKILCAVLSVSFLFMSAWGLFSYQLEKQDLSQSLDNVITMTAKRLGQSLSSPLWNLDDTEIARILDYEAVNENIRAIILRDEKGRFVAGRLKLPDSGILQDFSDSRQERQLLEQSSFHAISKIIGGSNDIGEVAVYADNGPQRAKLAHSMLLFALVAFLLFFGLSATLYLVLRRTIVRRLQKVEEAVSDVSIENLAVPIPVSGTDEIGRLAQSFRVMTGELQTSLEQQKSINEQLLQAQKMEAIGLLVGGVSHDFNNILGAIIGSAEMLRLLLGREQLDQAEKFERHISTIGESAQRASGLIRQMLILSMKQEINLASINLCEVVEHVVKLLQSSQDKSIRLKLEMPDEPAMVSADAVQMEQVLLNLCINACHAMTLMRAKGENWGGNLIVRLERSGSAGGPLDEPAIPAPLGYWLLSVMDTGVGMDAAMLQHIFTPFFTTKQKGFGSGLGLSMAYSIVKQQGGTISVDSRPGHGSTFRIFLPAIGSLMEESTDEPFKQGEEKLPTGSGLILVIDDDHNLQEIFNQILTECGFEVLVANNGAEGVALAKRHGKEIRLVVLDMNMPTMSGKEALPRIRTAASAAKILLTSGYKQDPRVQELRQKGVVDGFLHKPYSLNRLVWKINALLHGIEAGF